MLNNRLHLYRAARCSSRGGFTLVELLVVIGIIAILAGVALGPITRGIKQAQESTSIQVAHQMGALEFAYSNDYQQTYPYGATSEVIANLLLNGGYANNPSIFYVAGTPSNAKYTGSTTPYGLINTNVNWDYIVAGSNGLTSNANDLTPLCQLTGATPFTSLPQATGAGITLTINPTLTAFGSDGIAVYYKGNNAVFIKCILQSAAAATNLPTSGVPYVGTAYADPLATNYSLIVP